MRFSRQSWRISISRGFIPLGMVTAATARLIEFLILVQSGVPLPAAHLLSNHYNKTRDRYYAGLDRSSKATDGVVRFVSYAVEGFLDGLKEQLDYIRTQQRQIAWVNYIHNVFRDKISTFQRQKHLILDMPDEPVHRKNLSHVLPRVAEAYAGTGEKTLSRDINASCSHRGSSQKIGNHYIANKGLILAFRPPRYEEFEILATDVPPLLPD